MNEKAEDRDFKDRARELFEESGDIDLMAIHKWTAEFDEYLILCYNFVVLFSDVCENLLQKGFNIDMHGKKNRVIMWARIDKKNLF